MIQQRIKIDDKTYTKNVTCFKVGDDWFPKSKVAIDNYTKKYAIKEKLEEVFDIDTNEYVLTSQPCTVYLSGNVVNLCKSIVENSLEFIEDPNFEPNNNRYISIYDKRISGNSKYKPAHKIYNISNYDAILPKYTKIPNSLNFINYTFGFELETCQGEINKQYGDSLGFASLYDGSISGVEYVSNPMVYNNLHHLHKFLKVAKTSTKINKYCSLHIHIGNVNKSDKNLLSMYLLFQRLTDELNQLIVPYKKDIAFLYDKLQTTGRDHCKNLPKLPEKKVEEIYKLFKIFGLNSEQLHNHITQNNKWNVEGRYYSVNFMNYICKSINNTVEIRSLQSTYNFDYIVTWLLINCSIIDYAIKNADTVINSKVKIELEDCIEAYIPDEDILSTLKSNIISLKNLFYNSYHQIGDSLTNLNVLEDRIVTTTKSYNLYNLPGNYDSSYLNKYVNIKNNKSVKKSKVDDFKIGMDSDDSGFRYITFGNDTVDSVLRRAYEDRAQSTTGIASNLGAFTTAINNSGQPQVATPRRTRSSFFNQTISGGVSVSIGGRTCPIQDRNGLKYKIMFNSNQHSSELYIYIGSDLFTTSITQPDVSHVPVLSGTLQRILDICTVLNRVFLSLSGDTIFINNDDVWEDQNGTLWIALTANGSTVAIQLLNYSTI